MDLQEAGGPRVVDLRVVDFPVAVGRSAVADPAAVGKKCLFSGKKYDIKEISSSNIKGNNNVRTFTI